MYTTATTSSAALLGAPPPRSSRPQIGRNTTQLRLRFARLRASAPNDEEQPQRSEVDWDQEWKATMQKKQRKRGRPLIDLNMEQYVSRTPVYRDFPAREETDQFRRIERSNLRAWSDPKFTIAGFGVILALFVYMVMNAPA